MSYIEDHLLPGEHLIKLIKPHWIIFSTSFAWLIVTFLLQLMGPHYFITSMNLLPNIPVYKIIAFVTFCILFITAIPAYTAFTLNEFAVTSKRVILKTGLIRRQTLEIMLARIESIGVTQTVIGRILNYGTLVVSGIGGSKDTFIDYPNPFELRNLILEQLEKINQR